MSRVEIYLGELGDNTQKVLQLLKGGGAETVVILCSQKCSTMASR